MTQAPSIKKALEPCPFCDSRRLECGGDDKFVGVRCLDCEATGPNHYITGKEWNTRATLQPSSKRREAIAPLRTRLADLIHQNYEPPPEGFPETEPWNGGALDIVDMIIEEILASGLVQNEAGIRDDEREKCAKIADREAEFWQDAESSSAHIVAANIRSARDGGAES